VVNPKKKRRGRKHMKSVSQEETSEDDTGHYQLQENYVN
jgi:hypothetical protein